MKKSKEPEKGLNYYVGRAICSLRVEMTQGQLADACKIGRITLARIEGRGGNCRFHTLEKIARALDVRVSKIMLRAERLQKAARGKKNAV